MPHGNGPIQIVHAEGCPHHEPIEDNSAKLRCIVNEVFDIYDGSLGFYADAFYEEEFADLDVVVMNTERIPQGASDGYYRVIDNEFVRKTPEEIATIKRRKREDEVHPPLKALEDMDLSGETDVVKAIVAILIENNG